MKQAHVFGAIIARHTVTRSTFMTCQRLASEARELCFDCGKTRTEHANEPSHAFAPFRFSIGLEETGGIALARNLLGEVFLDGVKDAQWFLSLDDDVGRLRATDLRRMCRSGVDVVGAPLPGRSIQPECLQRAIALGRKFDSYEEIHRCLSPLLLRYLPEGPRWVSKDLIEVESTSAGCLLISRACIERMVENYGRFDFPDKGHVRHPPRLFDFTEDVPDDSYSFCRSWRDIGGAVYVDAHTTLTHQGVVDFTTQPLGELIEETERHNRGSSAA